MPSLFVWLFREDVVKGDVCRRSEKCYTVEPGLSERRGFPSAGPVNFL